MTPPTPARPRTVAPRPNAWREELTARRARTRTGPPVEAPQTSPPRRVAGRRDFIRVSFWGGIGLTLAGSLGLLADYAWPRNVRGFGGPVPAGHVANYPSGGEPVLNGTGQFWIANLDPSDTADNGTGGGAGLLALWRRCPHLGCAVPWSPRATLREERSGSVGWYQCPCHGSTYTRAGVLFDGPAPRSMDTMQIDIDQDGNIVVQTGVRSSGGRDNPDRAATHPRLPT